MTTGSLKRRLMRRTPYLSRLARSLDALEAENESLQAKLAPVLLSTDPGATDSEGLAVPPANLRFWVAGTEELEWFLHAGRLGAEALTALLAKHGLDIDRFDAVLDFGCGCGRVMRHLRNLAHVQLHGTDPNATAIDWCDKNLTFAEFSTNRLQPPLRYRAHSFDCVYAFSVFTHLTEALQTAWMAELRRILKPGGYLIISLHGDHYLPHINDAAQVRYRRGEMVVLGEEVVGQNRCAAFHPEKYVRSVLAREFEVVDFVPRGALGNPEQDVYLLKR